jgi:hypothetical protein
MKLLSQQLGEYDYAMRAASYGSSGNRETVAHAIKNLPTPELDKLRPFIAEAIKNSVARTQKSLTDSGIVLDEPHPLKVKASIEDAGSYFYKLDRQV